MPPQAAPSMTSQAEFPGAPEEYVALGARMAPGDQRNPLELLDGLQRWLRSRAGEEGKGWAQLLDADSVAGARHLASAVLHAERARQEGRAHLTDPGAELALYLAGWDQLPPALGRVGLREDSHSFVVVTSPGEWASPLLEALNLEPDPEAFPRAPSERTMARLGFSSADLRSAPPERWELLALELVALTDLPGSGPHHMPGKGGAGPSGRPAANNL